MFTAICLAIGRKLQPGNQATSLRALCLLDDYLSCAGATPRTLAQTRVAGTAAAAAALVVALQETGGAACDGDAVAAVHAAALEVLGPAFGGEVDLEGLTQTTSLLRAGTKKGVPGASTLDQLAQVLQKLQATGLVALRPVDLSVCCQILEVLCLRHPAGVRVLRQAHPLYAGAVIAAAFCVAAPPGAAAQGGPVLLTWLSDLCSSPKDVVAAMCATILQALFP